MLIILVRSGGVQPRGWREGGREGVHFWVAKYLVGFMRRIRIR